MKGGFSDTINTCIACMQHDTLKEKVEEQTRTSGPTERTDISRRRAGIKMEPFGCMIYA